MNENNKDISATIRRAERFQVILIGEGIIVGGIAGLVVLLYRILLENAGRWLQMILNFIEGRPLWILLWFGVLALLAILVAKLVDFEPLISGSGIPQLEGEMNKLESKLRRLYQLFAEGEDPVLLDEVREVRRQLEILRQDYETEQATCRRAARLEDLREQAAGIKDSWPNLTPEERQAVIRDCVERIVVDGPKVEIYYTFLKHGAES